MSSGEASRSIRKSAVGYALSGLGPGVDELFAALHAPVTARRLWLETWFDCYSEFQLFPVMVHEGGRLAGVAVLARRDRRGWVDVVAAGDGPSDRLLLPAVDQRGAELLAEAIVDALGQLQRPWTLSLAQLPVDDPVADAVARRLATVLVRPGVSAPTLRLGADRSLEAYTSNSYRQNLRTMENRLAREHVKPVLHSAREPEEVSLLARQTEPVRLARDRAEGRPSMLAGSRHRAFRRAILERLAHNGAVEITTLRLDNAIAAYTVVLLDADSRRLWDTAFAPGWQRFGAGHLVVAAALRSALADGSCEEFDFMRGVEDYKLRLATEVVGSVSLQAWSSRRTRAITHFSKSWRTPAYYRWLARRATRSRHA